MKKRHITWEEFFEHLDHTFLDHRNITVYGVPKGGMIVAGYLVDRRTDIKMVHTPGAADIIIDDLVDSGATMNYYTNKYPDTEFIPVFGHKCGWGDAWLIFPWEADHPAGEESVEDNITRVLEYIGEDPNREGLQETPKRVVKSWGELYAGYNQDPADLFTVFEKDGYDEIVLLKDIEMYSMCEHHMLPFYGRAHVAYIPGEKIVGLSKLARVVDMFARRLQNQERITEQVTDTLMKYLEPKAAACVIEAKHMCMCSRGVGKQNSSMITSSMKGAFMDEPLARTELMRLIG